MQMDGKIVPQVGEQIKRNMKKDKRWKIIRQKECLMKKVSIIEKGFNNILYEV